MISARRLRKRRLSALAAGVVLVIAAWVAQGVSAAPATVSASVDQASAYHLVTTAKATAAARAKGRAAGQRSSVADLPTGKTIGYVHFDGQSASSQRFEAAIKAAGAYLGYKVIACDPAGDPVKVRQCGTSLLAQGADLIMSYQHEPLEFGATVKDAKKRGALWANVGERVTPGPYMSQYVADDPYVQRVFDKWLVTKLRARAKRYGITGSPQILVHGAPQAAVSAKQQGDQIKFDMKKAGVTIVVNHDLDLANLVQDTLDNAKQTMQQYPKLAAMWTICDFCVPLLAQAAGNRTGADRPLVTGNFSSPQTAAGIRKGRIDGVVDVPWEIYAWTAFDQALSNWARGTTMGKPGVVAKYGMRFGQPYILDRSTVGRTGVPIYSSDYVAYFKAKWAAEYRR